MLNKTQLKKIINRAGKDGRLKWAYKDGIHYITDSCFLLKANDDVFDSELVGLMYKYFNMKPKGGDETYTNYVEMQYDKTTGKNKLVYLSNLWKGGQVSFFIEAAEIKDEYTLVTFLGTFIEQRSAEYALYGEWDREIMSTVLIRREYHELLAWDKGDIRVPSTQYNKGGFNGIMFHDLNTNTVLWILPVRGERPKTLNDKYVMVSSNE